MRPESRPARARKPLLLLGLAGIAVAVLGYLFGQWLHATFG